MPTGSTTARGYGHRHQKERARYAPKIAAGLGYCQQGLPGNGSSGTCVHRTRWISPTDEWHLGHNDARTAYIGETHADCNRLAGATKGAAAQAAARRRITTAVARRW